MKIYNSNHVNVQENMFIFDNLMFNQVESRIYSRNTGLRRDFSHPPGERRLRRHLWASSAAVKGNKTKQIWGACGAPNGFQYLTRSMRIPNMRLVLKLDNGKVVFYSERTESQTDVPSSTVLLYRFT